MDASNFCSTNELMPMSTSDLQPLSPANSNPYPYQSQGGQSMFKFTKKKPEVDVSEILKSHSESINALNQRESLLLEREKQVDKRTSELEQTRAELNKKIRTNEANREQLRIRKSQLDQEW